MYNPIAAASSWTATLVDRSPSERWRSYRYVYQHITLVPNLSVIENVISHQNRVRPESESWRAAIERLLAGFELKPIEYRVRLRPSAAATRRDQQVLLPGNPGALVDEPTSVLTPSEEGPLSHSQAIARKAFRRHLYPQAGRALDVPTA